ncbi:MAG: DUF4393 domain-containing protein [Actinomycetota bacterium]|nr:DUF4393 domain-containing protein [Actinomycetota bacterium]
MTAADDSEAYAGGQHEPASPDPGPDVPQVDLSRALESLPGLARIAASSWLNATQWGVLASWRLTRRLVEAVRDPDAAAELARELGVAVSVVVELGRRLSSGVPLPKALLDLGTTTAEETPSAEAQQEQMARQLRERGEALLMRSRDVWNTDQAHPAYERILDELAPDEARILVFLFRDGPQPSVDVRTGGPVGMVNSRLIAPGLTMIGARSGCRYLEYVPSYLNNLFRLGLVWFSRETLRDPGPYQVLEAQPDVLEAVHSVKMARVVRRSIQLTPFGLDFCKAVLAPGTDPASRPPHAAPGEDRDLPTS